MYVEKEMGNYDPAVFPHTKHTHVLQAEIRVAEIMYSDHPTCKKRGGVQGMQLVGD